MICTFLIRSMKMSVWPPSNTCFLGATQVHIPNCISIGSAILHSSWQTVLIFYNGPPLFPSKLPIHKRDLDSHLIHFLCPPESATHVTSPSVYFCRAHDHDRQTDRPRYSVCNNRPHLCYAASTCIALRCGLQKLQEVYDMYVSDPGQEDGTVVILLLKLRRRCR